ncbi:Uncharacterised protein [Salmonella enterica subsp. arizonae]|uniref:Uncharacterized protein n=1 Tax=Salmonella enterica subsp. arizonae TaxID=59203 RepID=A0A447R8M1_SALER|nr:Uncharacterised protein [Salmonella enterica subsp. arizonae]
MALRLSGLRFFGVQGVEFFLELVIIDAFIQLVAGLHDVDHVLLRPFLAQYGIDFFCGAVHGAKRRQRIERHRHVCVA